MTSRISELAANISHNTQRVTDYLSTHSLPFPSFDENGPVDLKLSPEAESARNAALNAMAELAGLLQSPDQLLRPLVRWSPPKEYPAESSAQLNATSLGTISRHDLARKVPVGGTISFESLAKQCNLHEPDIRRIIRYAIAHHFIFQEPQKGLVAHSAASRRLVDDQGAHDGLGVMFDDCYQSFGRVGPFRRSKREMDMSMLKVDRQSRPWNDSRHRNRNIPYASSLERI
jgi:hypothetical protein